MDTQNNFRAISITRGMEVIVDADVFDEINQYKWYAQKCGKYFYAARDTPRGGKTGVKTGEGKGKHPAILMHRKILNAPAGMEVDHISGNTLDNRKCNLRLCTHQQNRMNSVGLNKSSKYKGVNWHKQAKKWRVEIGFGGKRYYIGLFDDEKLAAEAYNIKAQSLFKEFANFNILEASV